MKKEVIPKKTIRLDLINSIDWELFKARNTVNYNRIVKLIQDTVRKESSEQ